MTGGDPTRGLWGQVAMDRKRFAKKLLTATTAALAIYATSALQVHAHHSHAMFDDAREITVSGTVRGVSYANPHVYLSVEAADADGETGRWSIEMSHIGNMIERGVRPDTINVGDEIVISMNPLRSGQRGGNYTRIVSINGIENAAEGSAWAPGQ